MQVEYAPAVSDELSERIESLLDSVGSCADDVAPPEEKWLYPDPCPSTHEPSVDDVFNSRILIVDDEIVNAKLAHKYLKEFGCRNIQIETNPLEVLSTLQRQPVDLVLLDVVMPELGGAELLTAIRQEYNLRSIPVIILTTEISRDTRLDMLGRGATDFLSKPIDPAEMVTRIRNALVADVYRRNLKEYAANLEEAVRDRTNSLAQTQFELVRCLARAAEFRDDDTGQHVVRVGQFAGLLASRLNMDETFVGMIRHAAQLHDIGKIGIPDSILLKPGKLTAAEFDSMRQHCRYGVGIFGVNPLKVDQTDRRTPNRGHDVDVEQTPIRDSHTAIGAWFLRLASSPLTRMAATIALTHHEKWDGSGYPLGLAGDDIPIEGRITAIADVFDALSSKRPYKEAFPLDKCFEIISDGRGTHFDPRLVDTFLACRNEVIRIRTEHKD